MGKCLGLRIEGSLRTKLTTDTATWLSTLWYWYCWWKKSSQYLQGFIHSRLFTGFLPSAVLWNFFVDMIYWCWWFSRQSCWSLQSQSTKLIKKQLQILNRLCLTSWILYDSCMSCVCCLFPLSYLPFSQKISNSAGPRLVWLWLQTLGGTLCSPDGFTDTAIHHFNDIV